MSLTKVSFSMITGAAINVLDYGAVGNGTTDDTAAIQAALDAAEDQQKSLYLPRTTLGSQGLYRITAPLIVSSGINIFGDGTNYSGLLCDNCSGFRINAGVNFVIIEKMLIGQAIRYSTTPNSHRAIETLGTLSSQNYWHIYRDLFIDGFQWSLYLSSIWSTVINSVVSVFGFGGINSPGQSVNNFVSNCSFSGSGAVGSAGIKIGDGTINTEGWMISDCLIDTVDIGVHGLNANNSHVRGCIIDFFKEYGVFLQSTANGPATNWIISDNYMATDTGASVGVRMLNNYSASALQHRGNIVSNNQILGYPGATLSYGIAQDGSAETNNVITGNRVSSSFFDCSITAGERTIVTNNQWKGPGFETAVMVNYSGNEGTIITAASLLKQTNGTKFVYYLNAPPSTGTFTQGDIAWNQTPAAGGTPGWVCVTSGTPGTWKAMANLAA